MLLNLIVNALEAMSGVHDRPRELTIVSRQDGPDAVLIEVRDCGAGLGGEGAERVFEPFYTTKPEGIGIGLSISRSIVEAHGGRLWASPNEPHGAVFRLSLPVAGEGTIMSEERAVVFVVDDDPSMRRSLDTLLRSVGLDVHLFSSAQEFMLAERPDAPGCLVLDVRLPGMSGLAFQQELVKAGEALPVIFLTGHGDVPMTARAMKAGAAEFLTKPFDEQVLLDAIHAAIERDRARRRDAAGLAEVKARYRALTEREREVMNLVVAGRVNKQIAAELGLSLVTIKVHRGQVMRKMLAKSVPELVRMADRLGLPVQPSGYTSGWAAGAPAAIPRYKRGTLGCNGRVPPRGVGWPFNCWRRNGRKAARRHRGRRRVDPQRDTGSIEGGGFLHRHVRRRREFPRVGELARARPAWSPTSECPA